MLGLRRMGHDPIVGTAKSADLALVDALDTPTADATDAIRGLRARGLPVVLRLHGAWNGSQGLKRPHGAGAAQRLLDGADRVIVSSRSHLVRLASTHAIDPLRIKLLAPPQPIFDATPASKADSAAPRVLVIGDGDVDGLAAALPAAATIDSYLPSGTDTEATDAFRARVRDADVVALVARHPWSDRVLLQACVDLGRPVVAACGPVTGEELCRPGLIAIAVDATAAEWQHALAIAFMPETRVEIDGDRTRGVIGRADQVRRLTAILCEAVEAARDCSGRLTA